jgi:hypothetical protein
VSVTVEAPSHAVLSARVGDLLPEAALGPRSPRRNEATAIVMVGNGPLDRYVEGLSRAVERFAAWDGRLWVARETASSVHRVLVVDRYGQVYAVFEGEDGGLPDASALEEWFKFLATACPECGVLDDPIGRGWVP